mgnify:CR=1 FL=1
MFSLAADSPAAAGGTVWLYPGGRWDYDYIAGINPQADDADFRLQPILLWPPA